MWLIATVVTTMATDNRVNRHQQRKRRHFNWMHFGSPPCVCVC
jgi:hypothetical protein